MTKKTAAILIIFVVALGLRVRYQATSYPVDPIISDAAEYVIGASNLLHYGVYNNELMKEPTPGAKRTPGYSVFLIPFMYLAEGYPGNADQKTAAFVTLTTAFQALLGAGTCVLAFLLAMYFFPLRWAVVVGLLTAFSPHLIAMDGLLLSETLFTFLLVGATGMYLAGNRLSGFVFGLSYLVRPIALFIVPVLAWKSSRTTRKWLLLGVAVAILPWMARNYYYQIGSELGWASVVQGSYVDLYPADLGYPGRTAEDYSRRNSSVLYLVSQVANWEGVKWYLFKKPWYAWKWSVVSGHKHIGEVYVYPMKMFGFHVDWVLSAVREAMKFIHFPLCILALLWICISAVIVSDISKSVRPVVKPKDFIERSIYRNCYVLNAVDYAHKHLAIIIIMAYFTAMFVVTFPIPRYTIPLRPFMYLMAVGGMQYVVQFIRMRWRNV